MITLPRSVIYSCVTLLISISGSVEFKMTRTKKERLQAVEAHKKMIFDEGCGICKKSGGNVFYLTPHSRCAHKSCYDLIEPCEAKGWELIKAGVMRFELNERDETAKLNKLHRELIELLYLVIERKTNCKSIFEFYHTYGTIVLTKLFTAAAKVVTEKASFRMTEKKQVNKFESLYISSKI